MDRDAIATRSVDDLVSVECERCDAEEFLGFRECRACARILDPRRTHATDASEPPKGED
jgi:hypothetical protein